MAHANSPRPQEAKLGGSLQVQGKPEQHSWVLGQGRLQSGTNETFPQKKQKKKINKSKIRVGIIFFQFNLCVTWIINSFSTSTQRTLLKYKTNFWKMEGLSHKNLSLLRITQSNSVFLLTCTLSWWDQGSGLRELWPPLFLLSHTLFIRFLGEEAGVLHPKGKRTSYKGQVFQLLKK